MTNTPSKFEDLDAAELYRAALADFALPVEEADKTKKKVLLAAFLEGGVEWSDYLGMHPELVPEPEPAAPAYEPSPANTIDNEVPVDPAAKWDLPEGAKVAVAVPEIIVAQPIAPSPTQQYLIKMTRTNPIFETRGHRFTQAHPYALVNAADADYILTREDGFRQATPSELQEFYG